MVSQTTATLEVTAAFLTRVHIPRLHIHRYMLLVVLVDVTHFHLQVTYEALHWTVLESYLGTFGTGTHCMLGPLVLYQQTSIGEMLFTYITGVVISIKTRFRVRLPVRLIGHTGILVRWFYLDIGFGMFLLVRQ